MEIGSEFPWEEEKYDTPELKETFSYSDKKYVFSGRTAIEYALEDIGPVKGAYLPSYCCQSMIDPFIYLGIPCFFYKVQIKEGIMDIEMEIPDECGVVLLCNYFGFQVQYPKKTLQDFQARGGIIIEDITHSFMSKKASNEMSDYYVASLRKWGAMLCGGIVYKKHGVLKDIKIELPSSGFIKEKSEAMWEKYFYLIEEKNSAQKMHFLSKFSSTNAYFDTDYHRKAIDSVSMRSIKQWHTEIARQRRRKNAITLYKRLRNTEGIEFLFHMEDMDCPIFVPVILENCKKRNELKRRLSNRKIYCPNHWQAPETKGADSDLYQRELSLICDQRYGIAEMERIAEAVMEEIKIINMNPEIIGGAKSIN